MGEMNKLHREAFLWGYRYMRCYIPIIVGLLALSTVIGFLGTLEPVYTGWIIDALTAKVPKKFFNILMLLACVQIVIMLLSLLNTWLNMLFQRKMTIGTESRLFSQIQERPEAVGMKNQGNLTNLFLSDLSTMTGIYTSLLPSVCVSVCTLAVICVRLFHIHRILLVLTLIVSVIPLFIAHFYGMKQAEIHRQEQAASDVYVGFLEETLPALRELQSVPSRNLFVGRLRAVIGNLFVQVRKSTMISLKSSSSFFLCNFLTSIFLLLLVGFSVLKGGTSVGMFVTAILYSQQIRTIIRGFGEQYQGLLSNQISTQRLMAVFRPVPEKIQGLYTEIPPGSDGCSLTIQNLSFGYSQKKQIFSHQKFLFFGPGLYVVKGRNGTGKTTLLNVIWGWIPPDASLEGSVCFSGCRRTDVAYAPQVPTIFSLSVADNLLLGHTEDESSLWKVLDAVGLAGIVRALPEGLATVLNEDQAILSKGQYQRLVLARCILQRPKILLLDEIETAIDKENEQVIKEMLTNISKKTLVILATHRDTFNDIATDIFELGSVVE